MPDFLLVMDDRPDGGPDRVLFTNAMDRRSADRHATAIANAHPDVTVSWEVWGPLSRHSPVCGCADETRDDGLPPEVANRLAARIQGAGDLIRLHSGQDET